MADETASWHRCARELARGLARRGLVGPRWESVFAVAPRHVFVPSVPAGDLLREAYADQVLVTRYRELPATGGGTRVEATSSLSQPAIVAIMLELLDIADGETVLEIGTGPGYNACLLCIRLGDHNVFSVDVQSDVLAQARARLREIGHTPVLAVADGEDGLPEHAPYHRIIATCAVARIPTAWLDQLTPDGRVVAPMTFGGALAVLDRDPDSGELRGGFAEEAGYFMPMRRPSAGAEPVADRPGRDRANPIDPAVFADPEFRLWLGLWIPGLDLRDTPLSSAVAGLELVTAGGRSVLRDDHLVTEYGESLWDKVVEAYDSWRRWGRPGRDRLSVTVGPREQHVRLDLPGSALSWSL